MLADLPGPASDWLGTDLTNLAYVAIGAVAMYATIVVFARLAGLRSFAKMSAFDFAMSVGLGTIVATTALSRDVSVPEGVMAAGVLFAAKHVVGWARCRFAAGKVVDNRPNLVMSDGEVISDRLAATQLTDADLAAKLREHGVRNRSEVLAVVMETTGDVSVILRDDEHQEVEDFLLQDVRR